MNSTGPLSEAKSLRLLAEVDAEMARIDERLAERRRQYQSLARLRAVCEPYMRQNPNLTVADAVAMDRRARPWAYRKPN
jgi:hypothetical protein